MAREIKLDLERAKRLKELRGEKPQSAVASELGAEVRTFQNWERGLGISWPNLDALATYYGVSTNWILYGDEKPEGARSQLDRIERQGQASGDLLAEMELRLADMERSLAVLSRRRGASGNGADAASSQG